MKQGEPLKRTGFKRKAPAWALTPKAERVYRMPTLADPAAFRAPQAIATGCSTVLKDAPMRSEKYRRAVASLPCIYCGIAGISQCAHANTGKGAGIKTSDLDSFPLCACQPDRRGCHSKFDQGALFTKTERRLIESAWIADTQRRIKMMGLWPKGLDANEE